jgi:acyl transferase domain-containing protein
MGAAKSRVGHLEASAGIAGFAKILAELSMGGEMGPNLLLNQVNPYIQPEAYLLVTTVTAGSKRTEEKRVWG